MIRRLHKTGATLAATIGLAMLAPVALAQAQSATPPQPAQASAPATQPGAGPAPNDAELKNFAHAAVDVQNIRKSIQPKLAAAKTADARKQVKQAAEKQMEAAVRGNHLSLQRYVQIANVVQTDSTVRAKVQSFMPPQPSKS
jgi:Domain of unknown function (DUF4168)